MSEWEAVSIHQCAEILDHLRIPVSGDIRSQHEGATPYYGANGLQGYIEGWLFDEDLILLAEDGGYFDEYATRPVAYKISGKSWVNNHAHVLRIKDNFDFDYIFYSLQHKNIMPFIKGGTRAKLNQKELREISLLTPKERSLQCAIGKVITTIDQAIESTQALIEKYQLIKAGLMHDLFTRGIGADGKLRPPREAAPELYQETAIGWIPKEWSVASLKDVFGAKNIVNGPFGSDLLTSELKKEGVPVIYCQDIRPGVFKRVSDSNVTDLKAAQLLFCNVRNKDILLAKVGTPPCDCCVYDQANAAIVTQDVIRIRPSSEHNSSCFSYWFNTSAGRKSIRRISIEGTRERVSLGEFKQMCIPIPTFKEQIEIGDKIDKTQKQLANEKLFLQKLRKQKAGLMHDLLTGKVQVKVENKEVRNA